MRAFRHDLKRGWAGAGLALLLGGLAACSPLRSDDCDPACAPGQLCADGHCAQSCTSDNDCQNDTRCQQGVCVPYTDADISNAQKDVAGKTEMQALIAYLQSLGLALQNKR